MSRRVPKPLPSRDRPDPLTTRQKCGTCGCPDALVLFQLPKCHNAVCPHFDPDLEISEAEVERRRRAFWGR